jgi:hypothetical protein
VNCEDKVSGLIVQIPDPVACHHLSVYLSIINYCGDCERSVSVIISYQARESRGSLEVVRAPTWVLKYIYYKKDLH